MTASDDKISRSTRPPFMARDRTLRSPSGPVSVASVKVVFTISGWAHVHSPAGGVLLEAGSILTIPPGLECQGFPAGHSRTVTFYLHPEFLADQVRWWSAGHPLVHHLHRALDGDPGLHTLQLATSAIHELTPRLARLAQSTPATSGDFAMLSIASEVFDAVGRLSSIPSGSVRTARVVPRREVVYAIELLRSDLSRHWRIDILAQAVSLSLSQLTRLFRAQVGISPAAFLRQLRADHMAELLATTGLAVGEAAAAVGWSDAEVASRAFKQRYGVAPRAYASFYRSEEIKRVTTLQPVS